MTDWDRGKKPDVLPALRDWVSADHNTWPEKRRFCKYCRASVKGWRKIDGKARLCDLNGFIHVCKTGKRNAT